MEKKKPRKNPFEGAAYNQWVRSLRASYRHRTDGGEPVVIALEDQRWCSKLFGVKTYIHRGRAEKVADRILARHGATLTDRLVADDFISIRVSAAERGRLAAAAAAATPGGIGLSEWCRLTLCAAVGDADAGPPAEVVE